MPKYDSEIKRRRTFAIISHPDAGKTTLTEKFLLGGEGHTTFTIAGPTGEGITSARSFTRKRRCVMVDSFRII